MTLHTSVDGGRANIGVFAGELLEHISGAAAPLSYSLFSGHDTTLLPLLLALNQTNVIWPSYASHIIFEVEKDGSGAPTFVNVKYNNELMSIPACNNSGRCSWAQFSGFMTQLTPTNSFCD